MVQRLTMVLMLGLIPAADQAGTVVGESIGDRTTAIGLAMRWVPAGAQVTPSDCHTGCQAVDVGVGKDHCICRVSCSDPVSPSP